MIKIIQFLKENAKFYDFRQYEDRVEVTFKGVAFTMTIFNKVGGNYLIEIYRGTQRVEAHLASNTDEVIYSIYHM